MKRELERQASFETDGRIMNLSSEAAPAVMFLRRRLYEQANTDGTQAKFIVFFAPAVETLQRYVPKPIFKYDRFETSTMPTDENWMHDDRIFALLIDDKNVETYIALMKSRYGLTIEREKDPNWVLELLATSEKCHNYSDGTCSQHGDRKDQCVELARSSTYCWSSYHSDHYSYSTRVVASSKVIVFRWKSPFRLSVSNP